MKRIIRKEVEIDQVGRVHATHEMELTDDGKEQVTESHKKILANCPNCGAPLQGPQDRRGNCSVCGVGTCSLCEAKCICGNPLCKEHRSAVGELSKAQKCCPKCAAEQKEALRKKEELENRKYILETKIRILRDELSVLLSGRVNSSEDGDDLMLVMQADRLKRQLAELGLELSKVIPYDKP